MGLSEEDQKTSQETRLKQNGETSFGRTMNESVESETGSRTSANSCCQTNGSRVYCCQNTSAQEKTNGNGVNRRRTKAEMKSQNDDDDNKSTGKKKMSHYTRTPFIRGVCNTLTWFDNWERDDTYATLSVVAAAVSVAFVYGYYKRMN